MCRSKILLLVTLVWIVTGLFTLLIPILEMAGGGLSDMPVNEEFTLEPAIIAFTGLILLLSKIATASVGAPWHHSYQLLPPPISS